MPGQSCLAACHVHHAMRVHAVLSVHLSHNQNPAAAATYGWDCPLPTFIYPGLDCGSLEKGRIESWHRCPFPQPALQQILFTNIVHVCKPGSKQSPLAIMTDVQTSLDGTTSRTFRSSGDLQKMVPGARQRESGPDLWSDCCAFRHGLQTASKVSFQFPFGCP